jgi:hypothetical protein
MKMTAYPATPEGRDMPADNPLPQIPEQPPKAPLNLGKYSKAFAAIAGLLITVLVEKNTGGSAGGWLPYVVAVASALGVYATPNTPAAP